jgi:hypothetical protein
MTSTARPTPARPTVRRLAALPVLAFALLLAACATGPGSRTESLQRALYDYSGAIRWNNFEVAYEAIDPAVRAEQPLTAFELERLKQVQVTRYDVVAESPLADGRIAREVEIGLVNRHTQAERVVRVRETWRYDEAAERWWQTDGLPRFAQDR